MEEDLIALLKDDLGVASVVNDRVYWAVRPQGGALPDIVLHNIGGPVDYHMGGPSGLKQMRIQIDCWSKVSKLQALSVKRAVEACLSGQQANGNAVEFQGFFIDNAAADIERVGDAGEIIFRERLDFIMWTGAIST